ncbi:MAG TPA: hypothetical protein VGP80_03005 [Gemmatimonadales bacterium]|nr:hypothetical protein [Gemmatimonadales bacterium]
MSRVFLLSPAWCGGKRAALLRREAAAFPLATRLRDGGAPLGEVFSFLSGLYFRGKLAYARQFAQATTRHPGLLIITPTRGLVEPDSPVTVGDLNEFASVNIDEDDARYSAPLQRDLERLLAGDRTLEVVLLGSVATGKYVEVLTEGLGERLLFPVEFVGRGDMSRGGLMLRCAREGRELTYVPVAGAVRHGPRPPRLERMR